jgi:hypothetical protein
MGITMPWVAWWHLLFPVDVGHFSNPLRLLARSPQSYCRHSASDFASATLRAGEWGMMVEKVYYGDQWRNAMHPSSRLFCDRRIGDACRRCETTALGQLSPFDRRTVASAAEGKAAETAL